MQTTHSAVITSLVLPRVQVERWIVTVVLMFGFAALTAAAAQLRISVPGTPVPITGQTFAVLLSGAALGAWAGSGSMLIYVVAGFAGAPVFAGGEGGWSYATGATFGYLVGFIAAAWIVGRLAQFGQDRRIWSAIPAFLTGNAVIYMFGVAWLWWTLDAISTLQEALIAGFVPFAAGDLIKIALAGILLPGAWWLADRSR